MDLGLQKKVALVAASSKGLGRAIAEELANEGTMLMLCARGEAALEATRKRLEAIGARVEAEAADLTESADVDRVVAVANENFGRIDSVSLSKMASTACPISW